MQTDVKARDVRGLFLADWSDVVFMHFEVDEAVLRRSVPLELDLYHGKAYVSLVAFTQKRLRPRWGGRLAEWLSRPVGEHEFLNVRTYVRGRGRGQDERGVYFLVEWISSRMARAIGPRAYGLPYELARMRYEVDEQANVMRGDIWARARLRFEASIDDTQVVGEASDESLEQFLLERYAAYTFRNGVLRRFRICHEPWPKVGSRCRIDEPTLLEGAEWFAGATLVSANYSPGVRDVSIGKPERIA